MQLFSFADELLGFDGTAPVGSSVRLHHGWSDAHESWSQTASSLRLPRPSYRVRLFATASKESPLGRSLRSQAVLVTDNGLVRPKTLVTFRQL